jgi:glucokinase
MGKTFYVLGYDVGGTKLGIGLASSDGRIIGQARLDNKDTHPDDILPQLVAIGKSLVADAGLAMSDIRAFGVSAPYPADPVNGIMTRPTNNPKWINVPIRKYLEDALGVEGTFENDANCAALAEWFFGAGRGCDDFIYLTMSTGIGGGIVAAGHLVRGKGFYAGEIGHIVIERNGEPCACGLRGCYEAYCGGRAIAQRIQRELKDQPDHPMLGFAGGKLENIDMIALEKAVRAGDDYAVKLWADMCDRNAQGLGILLNTFNPARLILGTFAWAIGDLFLDPIKKALPKYAWSETINDCEIVASELRRDIACYAGCAAALNYLAEQK